MVGMATFTKASRRGPFISAPRGKSSRGVDSDVLVHDEVHDDVMVVMQRWSCEGGGHRVMAPWKPLV